MAIHDLKTWPEPFSAVWSGAKTYEIREDDRGYKVGDGLLLREWDPEAKRYTGREAMAWVTYMTKNAWGITGDTCVMCWSSTPARVQRRGGG